MIRDVIRDVIRDIIRDVIRVVRDVIRLHRRGAARRSAHGGGAVTRT